MNLYVKDFKSNSWIKVKTKYTDEISYKSELQNFMLDWVKETREFIKRKRGLNRMGWINDNSSYLTNKQQEEIDYNYLINNKDKKKRNIKTAVPKRSRTSDRSNILQKKEIGKSMKTFKDETNNEAIDQTTQKFVLNEDLLAEISYRISMIPLAEKDTDASVKDTTGLDITPDDQFIMNLKKLENLDQSNISFNNKELQNTSGDTKLDMLNYSHFQTSQNWKARGVVLRKESEDSFIKMWNPRSSMMMSNQSKRLNTSQTNYSKATKNYNTGAQREIKVDRSFKKKRPVTTQSFRPQKRNFQLPTSNAIKDSSFYGSATSAHMNLM